MGLGRGFRPDQGGGQWLLVDGISRVDPPMKRLRCVFRNEDVRESRQRGYVREGYSRMPLGAKERFREPGPDSAETSQFVAVDRNQSIESDFECLCRALFTNGKHLDPVSSITRHYVKEPEFAFTTNTTGIPHNLDHITARGVMLQDIVEAAGNGSVIRVGHALEAFGNGFSGRIRGICHKNGPSVLT